MVAKADMTLKNGSNTIKWNHHARRWKFSPWWIRMGRTQMSSAICNKFSLSAAIMKQASVCRWFIHFPQIIWLCATSRDLLDIKKKKIKTTGENLPPDLQCKLYIRLQLWTMMSALEHRPHYVNPKLEIFFWFWKYKYPIWINFMPSKKNLARHPPSSSYLELSCGASNRSKETQGDPVAFPGQLLLQISFLYFVQETTDSEEIFTTSNLEYLVTTFSLCQKVRVGIGSPSKSKATK